MNTILKYFKKYINTAIPVALFSAACPVYAQLPQCHKIYMDRLSFQTGYTNEIYTYDPALPVSGTNPMLNTISLPNPINVGLTVSKVVGTTNNTKTFYTIAGGTGASYNIWYYDPVSLTWVNTGHIFGDNAAVNLAAGGDYVYALNALDGKVYRYDGTGNATLVITVPDFVGAGNVYDLIADCDGNFYLFRPRASAANPSTFLRKYSSTGVLLQSWTVNNPNNYGPNGGFAVAGNSIYTDNWSQVFFGFPAAISVASGTISGTTVDLINQSAPLPSYPLFSAIADLASCDEAIPRLAEVTIASSDTTFCGARKVDYWITGVQNPGQSPAYQWFVNGNPVAGATDTFHSYIPQNGDIITCNLVSSDYCVAIATANSNPIAMVVDNAIQPILSYNPNEFCTDIITAVLPTINTTGGTFTATAGLSINAATGEVTPSLSNPGEYVITYTNPPPVLCPLYSTTAVINVYSPADASIEIGKIKQPVCYGDSVILKATEASGNIYNWEPKERIAGAVDEPTAVVNREQSGSITLTVYAKGGCMDKDSVTIDAGQTCCRVFMPSAFSPNNDGMNDFMEIEAAEIQTITNFKIFNRYGQVVFETGNIKDKWDGMKDGKLCDIGVYYYLLNYSCDDGKFIQKKGDITLIR